WLEVDHPVLVTEPTRKLLAPGLYKATTAGGESKVSRYRYPTSGDVAYPGPEVVYRVTIARPLANFGVAVVSGGAVPHVVAAGDSRRACAADTLRARQADLPCGSGITRARRDGLRLPGAEEHGGRREDQAQHGHADADRGGQLAPRLVLVDRRQGREVALDGTREIVVRFAL